MSFVSDEDSVKPLEMLRQIASHMATKRALILGIGGQDGSYLAELLLTKGYAVHGIHRRSSVDNLWRIAGIRDKVTLHRGDLSDPLSVNQIIFDVRPDEIYNLADQDDVGWSHLLTMQAMDITAGAVGRLLEFIRLWEHPARIFQPLSATMFGAAPPPQDEGTPLAPASPYACAKAAAWHLCQHYRREHGLHVTCGIMYNHDSPRRGKGYLLGRIVEQARAVKEGKQDRITLANLDTPVDIGFAGDYMEVAWRLLQLDRADDWVVCSGSAPTVCQWAELALEELGVPKWIGRLIEGPPLNRPGKPPTLIGNRDKLLRDLGAGGVPQTTPRELLTILLRSNP